jgi:methylmalonyl-CoA/ethylmalonyl-CoA epimerase
MVTKINHIAIVVPDLEEGTRFWADALGLNVSRIEDVPQQQVRIAFLPVGDSNIELLEPTDDDSGVARYLQKKGPGLHHICLEVDDIEETLLRLKEANVQLIDEEPREGHDGVRLAFVHPKATGGTLVELYQLPLTDDS